MRKVKRIMKILKKIDKQYYLGVDHDSLLMMGPHSLWMDPKRIYLVKGIVQG